MDIVRYVREQLQRMFRPTDTDGVNSCDICGTTLLEHEWADIDRDGFVVDCSEKKL